MSQNALKLNEDKTDFIIFSPKQNQFTTKVINVGANKIPSSKYIKILGITMDRVLSMEKDISNTCRAANMQIRKLNSIRHYLTESSSKTLITSTVITRLDYCNSVYIGLPQKSLHRLQLTQNSAARTIQRIHRYHHITPVLQQLNWLTINCRCQFKILVLTFKALHSQTPQYICELLNWYTPSRPLRSASTTSLVPNRNRTVRYGRRLLDTSAAALWNTMPEELRNAVNVVHFKRLLKRHFMRL